jgi:hypothetical protein
MENLSTGLRDLAVTSQLTGAASDRDGAHSAPGSDPALEYGPAREDPDVTATTVDGRHLVRGQ